MLLGEQGMIPKHVPACIEIIQINSPTNLQHQFPFTKESEKG